MGSQISAKKSNKISEYILKHSRKKDKELKYDFMPSLLEIIERPAHIGGKVIIYSIFSLLIITIIWACMSKIDVVVAASGGTKPKGDINVVQAYSPGTIKQIYVTDGQSVSKGDVLIELDSEEIKIDVNQINEKLEAYQLQLGLYNKIFEGEDITIISIDDYSNRLRPFAMAIIEAEKKYSIEIESLKLQKSNYELEYKTAELTKEKYKENFYYNSELELQDIVIEQKANLISQVELSIENALIQHKTQIIDNIVKLSDNISQLNAQLQILNIQMESQFITAPIDGVINKIEVNTIGGVITTSQALLTIIPSEMPFEMECYVQNKDISDISLGNEVSIKLDAYPYSKYGTVSGTVKSISSSSFVNEQLGNVYIIKVEIINTNDKIQIISGLTGRIEIKVGKRSIISYFLEPIIKGIDESIKEK